MNFQQLKIIGEALRCDFNLTEVANRLHTSQSGVSKHIKDLEDELGVTLFERRGRRLTGLTEPGREVAAIVERMLTDQRNIKRIGEQFSQRDEGQLTIATTHTQARYMLPAVIAQFRAKFSKVQLILHQANPAEITAMVARGDADVGIATESLSAEPRLATFPFVHWTHGVIVPKGHALTKAAGPIDLATIAAHPIITYDAAFTGRTRIDAAFAAAGVTPDIVLSALDSDVIKTYVELGLGIGIITTIAYEPKRDQALELIPAGHLFGSSVSLIGIKRGRFLRDYVYRFIEQLSPELTEKQVRKAAKAS